LSLIDSNDVIDATKVGGKALREWMAEESLAVSAVSYIEVLGYHRLTEEDREDLEAFFSAVLVLPLSGEVIEQAVKLRQIRKMSLGDALVAGTALVHQLTLVTRNVKDFTWVDGLTVIDPTEKPSSAE
jgi:toxin FitB